MIAVLKRQAAQLGHLELHRAGRGLQLALVMAGAGVHPVGRSLVALRPAQRIGLSLQQGVERLLHRAAHHPAHMVLDLLLIDLNHRSQFRAYGGRIQTATVHGVVLPQGKLSLLQPNFDQFEGYPPFRMCERYVTLSGEYPCEATNKAISVGNMYFIGPGTGFDQPSIPPILSCPYDQSSVCLAFDSF